MNTRLVAVVVGVAIVAATCCQGRDWLNGPWAPVVTCGALLVVVYAYSFGRSVLVAFLWNVRVKRSYFARSVMSDPYYQDWLIAGWVSPRRDGQVQVEVQGLHRRSSTPVVLVIYEPVAAGAFAYYQPAIGNRLRVYGNYEEPHGLVVNDTVLYWHNILEKPVNLLDLE